MLVRSSLAGPAWGAVAGADSARYRAFQIGGGDLRAAPFLARGRPPVAGRAPNEATGFTCRAASAGYPRRLALAGDARRVDRRPPQLYHPQPQSPLQYLSESTV